MTFEKFEHRFPAHQNAVDIFRDKWASDLSKVCSVVNTGEHDLFVNDPRPRLAAKTMGNSSGRFDGMKILELGPLEGGHTYQLERLGAGSILAIEANVEAYLKCLIVKDILSLQKCQFMLGDFVEFLSSSKECFDVIFCSGVLYHMADPVNLVRLISLATDKCFVWTHYYDPKNTDKTGMRTARRVSFPDFSTVYYELRYPYGQGGKFWGGNKPIAAWMERDSILQCFARFGFTEATVLQETPDHPNGPCFSFAVQR